MDRRRFLLTSLAGALAAPLAAEAQQAAKVWRIALVCANFCDSVGASTVRPMEGFVDSLRHAGYVEGKNLDIDFRAAGVADDRLDTAMGRLSRSKVDVIVAAGTSAAVAAARKATRSTPIVMAVSGDADEAGFVGGLARPGSNVTGVSIPLGQLVTKQVQLLTELLPSLSAVTVLSNPNNPNHRRATAMALEAGQSLRKSVHSVRIESPSRYATAFAEITDARPDALLILPDPVLERGEVTQFALTARLPTMFTFGGPVVSAGGLIAYGPSLSDLYRRAAVYVGKILDGARPGDLPVEQPTTFELIINRQTARALGLTIPPALLARADQVVE